MYNRLKDMLIFHAEQCEDGEGATYGAAPIVGLICGIAAGAILAIMFEMSLLGAVGICLGGALLGLLVGDSTYLLCDLPDQLKAERLVSRRLSRLLIAIGDLREAVLDHVADKDRLCGMLDRHERSIRVVNQLRASQGIRWWLIKGTEVAADMPIALCHLANSACRKLDSDFTVMDPFLEFDKRSENCALNLAYCRNLDLLCELLRHMSELHRPGQPQEV